MESGAGVQLNDICWLLTCHDFSQRLSSQLKYRLEAIEEWKEVRFKAHAYIQLDRVDIGVVCSVVC